MHERGFIHRDIKPENFLISSNIKSSTIYIIDFGLAKRYKDPKTLLHIPYRDNKNITGTARYASLNTHIGIEQSRRDDLESLCYVLIYLLKGDLPWKGLTAKNKKEKYQKIMEYKKTHPIEELCKGYPEEFQEMLKYSRNLKFDEDPDYELLSEFLRKLFKEKGYHNDKLYDWSALAIPRKDSLLSNHYPTIRRHSDAKPHQSYRRKSQELEVPIPEHKTSEVESQLLRVPLRFESMNSPSSSHIEDGTPSAGIVQNANSTTLGADIGIKTPNSREEKMKVTILLTCLFACCNVNARQRG